MLGRKIIHAGKLYDHWRLKSMLPAVFGEGSTPFYVVQAFTAAILILAANTAYQDFPRLSSILARDRFMPRQFMNRGDRLVFSNGIVLLSVLAGLLLVLYRAQVDQLIHLYLLGVFTDFKTLTTQSIRVQGLGFGWVRITPNLMVKAGLQYIDRVDLGDRYYEFAVDEQGVVTSLVHTPEQRR